MSHSAAHAPEWGLRLEVWQDDACLLPRPDPAGEPTLACFTERPFQVRVLAGPSSPRLAVYLRVGSLSEVGPLPLSQDAMLLAKGPEHEGYVWRRVAQDGECRVVARLQPLELTTTAGSATFGPGGARSLQVRCVPLDGALAPDGDVDEGMCWQRDTARLLCVSATTAAAVHPPTLPLASVACLPATAALVRALERDPILEGPVTVDHAVQMGLGRLVPRLRGACASDLAPMSTEDQTVFAAVETVLLGRPSDGRALRPTVLTQLINNSGRYGSLMDLPADESYDQAQARLVVACGKHMAGLRAASWAALLKAAADALRTNIVVFLPRLVRAPGDAHPCGALLFRGDNAPHRGAAYALGYVCHNIVLPLRGSLVGPTLGPPRAPTARWRPGAPLLLEDLEPPRKRPRLAGSLSLRELEAVLASAGPAAQHPMDVDD